MSAKVDYEANQINGMQVLENSFSIYSVGTGSQETNNLKQKIEGVLNRRCQQRIRVTGMIGVEGSLESDLENSISNVAS